MTPTDYKFVMMLSNRIEGFIVKSNSPLKVNCRCAVCGDSQKNKSKKRGWFTEFKDGVRYGCFNCGVSLWLREYLKQYEPVLYDEYIMEGKLEWMRENGIANTAPPEIEAKNPIVINKSRLKPLLKISSLHYNHPAKKYVETRKIPSSQHYRLFYVENFNKFVNGFIPDKMNTKRDEPRLVIPFLDENKKLFGFAGRSFSTDSIRYITIMLKDKPKVFGLDTVNKNKRVYVVEGPIDSLFLENAVAMAGTGASYDFDNAVYVYDCEPRNNEIVKFIEKDIEKGKNVVIWPEKMARYGKDINDFVKNGLTSEQIKSIIDKHTYNGLMAKLKLAEWRKS